MNLDDMNIPQFGLSTPVKDTINVGFIFVTIGLVAGIAAAIANNYVVRKTVEGINYGLGEHFIKEVKRINEE